VSPTRSTSPSTPRTPAQVAFVGAGPGDPGLLTVRASELLAAADAVVIDQVARHDVVERWCAPGTPVVDAGHGDHGENLTHASRAKLVVRAAKAHPGGLVVRLMDGDPAVFNGLAEEATACVKAGVSFEVVPGVSSVTAVPSYAGVPLTSASSTGVHVLVAGLAGSTSRARSTPRSPSSSSGRPTRPHRPSTPSSPPVATVRLPWPSPSAARAPTSAP
jgi:uroporphyrinogen III methyltransferase/synthase